MRDVGEPEVWMYVICVEVVVLALASARFWPLSWPVMLLVLNGALVLAFVLVLTVAVVVTCAQLWRADDDG